MPFVAQIAINGNKKTLFIAIFDPLSLIVNSVFDCRPSSVVLPRNFIGGDKIPMMSQKYCGTVPLNQGTNDEHIKKLGYKFLDPNKVGHLDILYAEWHNKCSLDRKVMIFYLKCRTDEYSRGILAHL